MLLSPHFDIDEFQPSGPMPAECIFPYGQLCEQVLEPVRLKYNESVDITSGYRSPAANEAAGGARGSQHVATANYCAADFVIKSMQQNMRPVFDYIRQSMLEFDQVILEHGKNGDIVHVSWSKAYNRKEALEGATANQSAYTKWDSTGSSTTNV